MSYLNSFFFQSYQNLLWISHLGSDQPCFKCHQPHVTGGCHPEWHRQGQLESMPTRSPAFWTKDSCRSNGKEKFYVPSQKQEGISHTWCNTCIACEKLSLSIKISKKQRLWVCLNSQVKKLLFRLWFVHLFMRKYISRPWNCIMGANSMLVWKLSLVLANRITGY